MTNVAAYDGWSLVHVVSGALSRRAGLSLAQAVAVAVAWELLEHELRNVNPGLFDETVDNAAGDVIAMLVGFFAAG